MTVLEVLQSSTDYFKKRGVESPRLNAEHLLAFTLKRKRIELYLEFERVLTDAELAPLRNLIGGAARASRSSIGSGQSSRGPVISCDKRAVVPRPKTEQLV